MSRMLKVMIVLLAIAAMVAPAMAEDRLSLNGQMRVRAFYVDPGTTNEDTGKDDPDQSFVDQRLRIGGKLSVAEGVSITFRFDETEKQWGDGGNEFGAGRMPQDGMQWDRAYMDLDFGTFKVRAGQASWLISQTGAIDIQDAGVQVVAGPVKAFLVLDDSNGNASDSFVGGLTYSQKIENIKFEVLTGIQTKSNNVNKTVQTDEEVYLIGADIVASLDALTLTGELDYFTGDANATQDAMGLQLYVKADFAVSDTVNVGAQGFYAMAADDDEVQYSYLGNSFNDWKALTAKVNVGGMAGEKGSHFTHPFTNVFEGDSAGLIGLNGYGKVKVNEALALAGAASYLLPEDDDKTDADSAIQLAVSSSYEMLTNAYLDATLQYTDFDESDRDGEVVAGMGLFVNF